MSMKTWAEREVEIAKKKERGNDTENEFDYGCACYDSALKAFNSLCEDGHSGFSIGITKAILNRLIDGKALTPIEDTEDVWNYTHDENNGTSKVYQCKRMSSLFKKVDNEGNASYSDVNRYYCRDIDSDCTYTTGIVTEIINEMYPIAIPYIPSNKPIEVFCEDFLTDKKNGDYDTKGVLYAIKDGDRVEINRFFAEKENKMIEITKEDYEERKSNKIKI